LQLSGVDWYWYRYDWQEFLVTEVDDKATLEAENVFKEA
jgi:hypothetical protein